MYTHMQIFAHLINELFDTEEKIEIKPTKMSMKFQHENHEQNEQK